MTTTKQSTLLDLADSDSDSGFNTRVSVTKATDNMPAAKKPKGRPAANKVMKPEPKTTTRRVGAKAAAALKGEVEKLALTEKTTNDSPKPKRGRKAKKMAEEEADDVLATPPNSDEAAKTRGGRGRPKKSATVPDSVQKKVEASAAKRGRRPAAKQVDEQSASVFAQSDFFEIPETQQARDMSLDADEELDQVEDLPTFSRFSAPPSAQRINSYHIPHSVSKRSASILSHDDDPSVRRRLGELAKKYEALELRYRDLRNVAVVEAERNFDRLKKQSEERTQCKLQLAYGACLCRCGH